MAPRAFLYPLVAVATVATVVASQALISGAFSLTHQCVQLRYSPRVSIVHTSRSEMGQIYIPEVNGALMIGCLVLVVGFGSSTALGGAYGVAVTGTMVITTVLFCVLARQRWRWPVWRVGTVAIVFLGIDLAFLSSNMTKVRQGGWVPLAIAAGVFLMMSTWHRGTKLLNRHLLELGLPLEQFLEEVERIKPPRVEGSGVFLTELAERVPLVLQRHLTYNKVLQREVVLLAIITDEVPEVEEAHPDNDVPNLLRRGEVRLDVRCLWHPVSLVAFGERPPRLARTLLAFRCNENTRARTRSKPPARGCADDRSLAALLHWNLPRYKRGLDLSLAIHGAVQDPIRRRC